MIHTVKGFGVVNKAETDVFLELLCFFDDPTDVDNLISGSSAFCIIFGSESSGIAYDILKDNLDDCYRIPTTDKIRSLNLSNCAAIMLFLASEQLNDSSVLSFDEPDSMKGKFFIENVNLDEVASNNKEIK